MKSSVTIGYLLMIACLLINPAAKAWSLDTHLYIATRVLEDALPDGKISICADSQSKKKFCSKQYPLPDSVIQGLQANPSAYLAGTLGPDVYPDLIAGQLTVHPGVENGWQTDDWLKHLMKRAASNEERAWVYGYLSHASSDIFAHTWVNQYAGGLFDLAKNNALGSNEIELRHFTLERYIADRTPRIWEQVDRLPKAPKTFIADELILSNSVANQYQKSGSVPHLVLIEFLHQSVSNVRDEIFRLQTQINKIGLTTLIPLRQAEVFLSQQRLLHGAAKKALEEAISLLKTREELIAAAEKIILDAAALIDSNLDLITGWEAKKKSAEIALNLANVSLNSYVEIHKNALSAVNKLVADVGNITKSFCGGWFKWICRINPAFTIWEKSYELAQNALQEAERNLGTAQKLVNDLSSQISNLINLINDAADKVKDANLVKNTTSLQLEIYKKQRELEQETVTLADKANNFYLKKLEEAQEKLNELEKDLTPVAKFLAQYNLLVLLFDNWSKDIRKASIAYIEASEKVSHNFLDKSSENVLKPYLDWIECWSPVLVAVPNEIPQTICTAKDAYKTISNKLISELYSIVEQLGVFGWLLAPNVKLNQEFKKKVLQPFESKIRDYLGKARDEIITFGANRQLADMVRYMSSKSRISDDDLRKIFETNDSKQPLLEIPDIAKRISIDTGLKNDQLDEKQFPALYNSIVLSKIALLDAKSINEIFKDLFFEAKGFAPSNSQLYPENDTEVFSILFNAIKSIDGNHQWQKIAPPYPTSQGTDLGFPSEREFGRSDTLAGNHSGFRLWGNLQARKFVFNQIFQGPLNLGLESHPDILNNYYFPSCAQNQFPSTTDTLGNLVNVDLLCRITATVKGIPGQYGTVSKRQITQQELVALSAWELRLARNEIFARYGLQFKPISLRQYFEKQAWYRPKKISQIEISKRLTNTEWKNIEVIKELERKYLRKK